MMLDYTNKTKDELIEEIESLKQQLSNTEIILQKRHNKDLAQNTEGAELNEKYYRLIPNNISNPVFVKDEQSRLLCVNDAFCTLFDLPRENILGKTLAEDVSEEERIHFLKIDNQVLSDGKENNTEEELTVRGGETRTILTRKSRFVDNDGSKYIVGIISDITEQKSAEIATQDSEEKYKALYNNAPLSYQSLNEDGTFRDVNPAWLNTLGYKREEIIGKKYANFLHPDWKKHFEKNFPKFKKRGYINDVQFKIRHKSGHFLDISFNGCIGYNSDGSVRQTYCVFQDITERKQSEEELRFQANLLNAVEQSIIATKPNGEIIYCNPFAEKMFGYTSKEAIGKNIIDVTVPQLSREQGVDIMETLNAGKSWSGEFEVQHRDGTVFLSLVSDTPVYNDKGEMIAIIGVSTDITERKKADFLLRESEERLRLALKSANQGLYDLNIQTGDAIVSPEYATMLGYDPSTFTETNQKWINRLHPDDIEITGKTLEDYLAGKTKEYRVEFRLKTKSGKYLWILSVGSIAEYDKDGNPIRMLGTHTDISERKQAETKLRESEQKHRLLLDSTISGIAYYDIKGILVLINKIGARNLGGEPNDFIGKHISEFLEKEMEIFLWERIKSTINNGKVDIYEDIFDLPPGQMFLSSTFHPVQNANGETIGVQIISTDITSQKNIEAKIKESESNLISLINNSENHIWSLDRDYQFIIFNKTYANMFIREHGVEVKKGLDSREFLKPEELDFWVPMCESVFSGNRETFDFSHTINEKLRYFQTTLNPIYEGKNVTGLTALSVDITDMKLAEQKLENSNERYKTLFDDSPVPLWEEDFTELIAFLEKLKNDNDFVLHEYFDLYPEKLRVCIEKIKILNVNQAAVDLHMAKNKHELLTNLSNTFTEKSYETFKEEVVAIAEGKNDFKIEGEVKTLTGELRYIHLKLKLDRSNPNIKKALVSTSDITARKQAEDYIRLSEYKFRIIFEESTDGIMLLDAQSNPVEVNNKICEILGYTKEELLSINANKHIHPEDIKNIQYEDALKKLQSGKAIYTNYRLITKEGSVISVELGVKMLDNGMFLNIIRDITRRIKLEEEAHLAQKQVLKLNEELEQKVIERTQQLELANKELQTFTYSVSHDLKAPLRGIEGYSKLLQDTYSNQLDQEANLFLTNIRDSSLKMNQLIDDLLEYSKLERSQILKESIEIKDLINQIFAIHSDKLQKENYQININLENTIVTGDFNGLKIAFRNIIENAIKFTSDKNKPIISISMEEKTKSWIFTITDNGVGFDMKFKDKVFEIFQRLHRAEEYAGTGIGLALVNKAMQRMNGKAWAESVPNEGTSFYLEIPKG